MIQISSLCPRAAGGRCSASGGAARGSGASRPADPRRAVASGASRAAAGGPAVQTQHHHLLREAPQHPHQLEARAQGHGRGGDHTAGGERVYTFEGTCYFLRLLCSPACFIITMLQICYGIFVFI